MYRDYDFHWLRLTTPGLETKIKFHFTRLIYAQVSYCLDAATFSIFSSRLCIICLRSPFSFLSSSTSNFRALFSSSRKRARIAIWFSFRRRASRLLLAAWLFTFLFCQYLSNSHWSRVFFPQKKYIQNTSKIIIYYQTVLLIYNTYFEFFISSGTNCFRRFLIMGCGLSSSSEKRLVKKIY